MQPKKIFEENMVFIIKRERERKDGRNKSLVESDPGRHAGKLIA